MFLSCHLQDWHCGRPDMPSSISERDTVDALSEQLHSKNEMEAVTAAYTLAATQQPESVEVLMDALQELPDEMPGDPLELNPKVKFTGLTQTLGQL
jgi:hypothetical protein